jgi:N utilization substance protein B
VSPDAQPDEFTASRHAARERAFHLLYEAETKGVDPADVLAELPIEPEPYTATLVAGVAAERASIDDRLSRLATGWKLERMPALDRAVLRLGVYELGHQPEVPTGVVLSEAVELASQYSTDESSRFVNGVLAAAATELRPPRTPETA